MVTIARKNVNITIHAGDKLPHAAFSAVSHFVAIIISMMQTMTSMMITMPLRGSR